jgi:hypothetical protein
VDARSATALADGCAAPQATATLAAATAAIRKQRKQRLVVKTPL